MLIYKFKASIYKSFPFIYILPLETAPLFT